MKEIPITKGLVTLVDDDDFEWLSKIRWHLLGNGRTKYAANGSAGTRVRMHRLILNCPAHMCVDHIDGNGLNNQRHNLRICTAVENRRNVRRRAGREFKGVYPRRDKWRAVVWLNGKAKYLGTFLDRVEAARAYDAAAREIYGQFANLNFSEAA